MIDMTPQHDGPEPDDLLLAELAAATAELMEPPTPQELDAARAAREQVGRDQPGELADLAFDSLLDDAVAVRSAGLAEARQLTFYADDATVHVEVTADLLICRVETGAPVEVTLVALDGARHALRSVGGDRHELEDPPAGPVRLECAGAAVVTSWFRL